VSWLEAIRRSGRLGGLGAWFVAIIDVTLIAWESITSLGGPFPAWGSALVGACLLAGLGLFSARVAPAYSADGEAMATPVPVPWYARVNWPVVVLTLVAIGWGLSLYLGLTWPRWMITAVVVVVFVALGGWIMRTATAARIG
jgi:hypothetical protein